MEAPARYYTSEICRPLLAIQVRTRLHDTSQLWRPFYSHYTRQVLWCIYSHYASPEKYACLYIAIIHVCI
jgi:hypothetical protein